VEALRTAVAELMRPIRTDLESLVRIPSISADAWAGTGGGAADPAASEAMRGSAEAVSRLLASAGLDVDIVTADGGLPAVLGRRAAPAGAPTLLLYAHHDVQPTGDRGDWDSDPFQPVERDGRLFGRGAADDKAGIALHLAALRALGDDLGVGVTVLVDGEEEIGSPTLSRILDAHCAVAPPPWSRCGRCGTPCTTAFTAGPCRMRSPLWSSYWPHCTTSAATWRSPVCTGGRRTRWI
jgi:acetylornithine deacetylase/succinyl-diaminopimelate desuccinylase-like protein